MLKFILPCMILSGIVPGIVMAQEKPTLQEAPAESKAQPGEASANRKAYDALYTDILKTLPQEGKSKVDSARGRDAKAELKQPKTTLSAEEVKKDALEKRKKELDELPPEVKARVDKVLSDLDNRRKEKQTEFKELKD
ncbi:MAG: hypothetical protein ABI036_02295 [Fibrobacteria bacterium]